MKYRCTLIAATCLLAGCATMPSAETGHLYIVKMAEPTATTDYSSAIAQAIKEAASAGGGVVELPAINGAPTTYLTGPIRLESNITLQIDKNVTVRFVTDRSRYPLVKTRYECTDIMNYSPLIYAYDCKNIKITGEGTLDGQGQAWWTWSRGTYRKAAAAIKKYTEDRAGKYPLSERVFGDAIQGLRPTFIEPYGCDGVIIEGVTLRESPFWNIHPLYSNHVTVRNVTVFGDGPNTDGCDPDSSTNIVIEHCHFTTGDDCIAIKSGRDGDGLRVNKPTENLTIRDCTMSGGHGAVAIGSETSGSIRNVLVENCAFDGPDSGVRIKSTRGRGGVVENITFRNCTIDNTKKYAITLNMRYANAGDMTAHPFNETTPVFRNITLENLTCHNSPQAMYIIGLPESPIQNLTMKNVTMTAEKGARVSYVNNFRRDNVVVTPKQGDAWTLQHVTLAK